MLIANEYPMDFIVRNITARLKKIYHEQLMSTNNKTKPDYARSVKVSLPFHEKFFVKCKQVLQKYNLIPIPKINKSLQPIVKLGKDSCKKMDRCGVVYKISCNDCKGCYIGESKRALHIRISEHQNKNKNKNTVVGQHMSNHGHKFKFDKIKILDNERDWNKRLYSEMLHIQAHTDSLNIKEDFRGLSNTYSSLAKCIS